MTDTLDRKVFHSTMFRKSLLLFPVLLLVAIMATGCDFFRAVAGRPTSKDIEAKRMEILRSAQDDKGVAQEGSPVKPGMTGEKPGMDAVVPGRPAVVRTGIKPGEKKRYYVILGAFSSRENAVRYAARIESYGYEPEFFGFTEGRTAVGIGGTDDPEEAKAFMRELKRQDFCPDGVWILDRKRK